MTKIQCVILLLGAFLFSSCSLGLFAVHGSFPFVCFEKACRQQQKMPTHKKKKTHSTKGKKRKKNRSKKNKVDTIINPPVSFKRNLKKDSVAKSPQLKLKAPVDSTALLANSIKLDSVQKISKKIITIYFESDEYIINETEQMKVKEWLDGFDLKKTKMIYITGFTDSDGDISYNKKLSSERAKRVYKLLISHNISVSKLTLNGMGEAEPVSSNETDEGRMLNRRVEIMIENEGD